MQFVVPKSNNNISKSNNNNNIISEWVLDSLSIVRTGSSEKWQSDTIITGSIK